MRKHSSSKFAVIAISRNRIETHAGNTEIADLAIAELNRLGWIHTLKPDTLHEVSEAGLDRATQAAVDMLIRHGRHVSMPARWPNEWRTYVEEVDCVATTIEISKRVANYIPAGSDYFLREHLTNTATGRFPLCGVRRNLDGFLRSARYNDSIAAIVSEREAIIGELMRADEHFKQVDARAAERKKHDEESANRRRWFAGLADVITRTVSTAYKFRDVAIGSRVANRVEDRFVNAPAHGLDFAVVLRECLIAEGHPPGWYLDSIVSTIVRDCERLEWNTSPASPAAPPSKNAAAVRRNDGFEKLAAAINAQFLKPTADAFGKLVASLVVATGLPIVPNIDGLADAIKAALLKEAPALACVPTYLETTAKAIVAALEDKPAEPKSVIYIGEMQHRVIADPSTTPPPPAKQTAMSIARWLALKDAIAYARPSKDPDARSYAQAVIAHMMMRLQAIGIAVDGAVAYKFVTNPTFLIVSLFHVPYWQGGSGLHEATADVIYAFVQQKPPADQPYLAKEKVEQVEQLIEQSKPSPLTMALLGDRAFVDIDYNALEMRALANARAYARAFTAASARRWIKPILDESTPSNLKVWADGLESVVVTLADCEALMKSKQIPPAESKAMGAALFDDLRKRSKSRI